MGAPHLAKAQIAALNAKIARQLAAQKTPRHMRNPARDAKCRGRFSDGGAGPKARNRNTGIQKMTSLAGRAPITRKSGRGWAKDTSPPPRRSLFARPRNARNPPKPPWPKSCETPSKWRMQLLKQTEYAGQKALDQNAYSDTDFLNSPLKIRRLFTDTRKHHPYLCLNAQGNLQPYAIFAAHG
jgi:hypothetical protein